jgi:Fur family ferric uptake transcriptional regulator
MRRRHPKRCGCAARLDAPAEGGAPGLLRNLKRKVTGPRKAVLHVLAAQQHPLTALEIHSKLAKGSCDLATVYRSLRLLESAGAARRYDFGDGAARFEMHRGGIGAHHHHLVCTRCAGVVEIEECAIQAMEKTIAERNGFKSVSHRLEFFGVCPACQ